MRRRAFRVVQGCPVLADVAPYIAIVVADAGATVRSIYRGEDAAAILHRHGKHTQRELYEAFLHGRGAPANEPGRSTHELRSDGVAYPSVPDRRPLPWWCQGFDVDDRDVARVEAQAARHGWRLFRPYPSGAERHHLNFRERPRRPRFSSRLWWRILWVRAHYPRR